MEGTFDPALFFNRRLFSDVQFCFASETANYAIAGTNGVSGSAAGSGEGVSPLPALSPLYAHRLVLALRSELLQSCGLHSLEVLDADHAVSENLSPVHVYFQPWHLERPSGSMTTSLSPPPLRAGVSMLLVYIHGVDRSTFSTVLRHVYEGPRHIDEFIRTGRVQAICASGADGSSVANTRAAITSAMEYDEECLRRCLHLLSVSTRFGVPEVAIVATQKARHCLGMAESEINLCDDAGEKSNPTQRLQVAGQAWLCALGHCDMIAQLRPPTAIDEDGSDVNMNLDAGADANTDRDITTDASADRQTPALSTWVQGVKLAALLRADAIAALCRLPLKNFLALFCTAGRTANNGATGNADDDIRGGLDISIGAEAWATVVQCRAEMDGAHDTNSSFTTNTTAALNGPTWSLPEQLKRLKRPGPLPRPQSLTSPVAGASALVLAAAAARADVAAVLLETGAAAHVQKRSQYTLLPHVLPRQRSSASANHLSPRQRTLSPAPSVASPSPLSSPSSSFSPLSSFVQPGPLELIHDTSHGSSAVKCIYPLEAALRSSEPALIRLYVSRGFASEDGRVQPVDSSAVADGGNDPEGRPSSFGASIKAEGAALLHVAASMGDVAHCRLLLSHAKQLGLDANYFDDETGGLAPLHVAATAGHVAVVALLLEHGAVPNLQDVDGDTALHMASNKEVVIELLSSADRACRANTELPNLDGQTPLHKACRDGNIHVVSMLIEYDASVRATDDKGQTPLHHAARCCHEHPGVALVLLKASETEEVEEPIELHALAPDPGVISSSASEGRRRPASFGSQQDMSSAINTCLAAGRPASFAHGTHGHHGYCDPPTTPHRLPGEFSTPSSSPLASLASPTSVSSSPVSLSSSASSTSFASSPSRSPVRPMSTETAFVEEKSTANTSLSRVGDPGACGSQQPPPISQPQQRPLMPRPNRETLLRTSYLAAKDNEGNTALHVAVSSRMMKLLVENGARCDSFNKQGQTPLHVLCTHGLAEEVERWRQMQYSAESHAEQGEGTGVDNEAEEEANALHIASDVVDLFMSHGVQLSAQTFTGETALHLAITRAGEAATQASSSHALLSTVPATTEAAAAALEAATEASAIAREAEALVVALVGAGAPLHMRNCRGLSPLDLAQTFDDDATKAAGSSAAETSVAHAQGTMPTGRSHGLVVSLLRHVRHAPPWVPDENVQRCESLHCGKPFSVTARRHHCRHCGRVICGACSGRKMALPQLGRHKRVRVCQLCWSVLNFRKLT